VEVSQNDDEEMEYEGQGDKNSDLEEEVEKDNSFENNEEDDSMEVEEPILD